jgi:hypothetical protein
MSHPRRVLLLRAYRPGTVVAASALVVTAAAAVLSLYGALRLAPVPQASFDSPLVNHRDTAMAVLEPDVSAAVDLDPFRSDRHRPVERFRMPGERSTAPRPPVAGLPPSMRLTGTVVYPSGGGAALLEGGGQGTRLVRVGERVGELTLREVGREQAVFVSSSGNRVVIRVHKEGR